MQPMISNNERAVWLLTGKSGHEAILAHFQRVLRSATCPAFAWGRLNLSTLARVSSKASRDQSSRK